MNRFVMRGHAQYINGRKLVVWGTGNSANWVVDEISTPEAGFLQPDFYVAKDYKTKRAFRNRHVYSPEVLSPNEHYVIIASELYSDEIENELLDSTKKLPGAIGYKPRDDYFRWFFSPSSPYYPYDYTIDGKRIGKYCTHPEFFSPFVNSGFIRSIGRFCLFNDTAYFNGDHKMDMICQDVVTDIKSKKTYELNKKYGSSKDAFKGRYVDIGNDVWIGAGAFINCSRCHVIGDGAIIGSNAVITQDVPPYAIMGGIPAKVLRYRFTHEQIECLLRVKWWDWSDEEREERLELLYNPQMFFEEFMGV